MTPWTPPALPILPPWSEAQWAWLLFWFSLTAWLLLELIEFCDEQQEEDDDEPGP
jgi:hypothetical protein